MLRECMIQRGNRGNGKSVLLIHKVCLNGRVNGKESAGEDYTDRAREFVPLLQYSFADARRVIVAVKRARISHANERTCRYNATCE